MDSALDKLKTIHQQQKQELNAQYEDVLKAKQQKMQNWKDEKDSQIKSKKELNDHKEKLLNELNRVKAEVKVQQLNYDQLKKHVDTQSTQIDDGEDDM